MTGRHALALGLALCAAACGEPPDDGTTPPIGRVARGTQTVVLVAVDGLQPAHLEPYGYGLPTSPNLTALAAEGVVFEDAVAVCTGVNAALASLLTGLHPEQHGVGSLRHRGQHALADSRTTLAERFREAGWRTFGVVARPQLRGDLSGLDQGFERWLAPALHEGPPRRAEQSVPNAQAELARLLAEPRPLFLLVHLADPELRVPASGDDGGRFLPDHLAAVAAERPLVAAALTRLEEDPQGAVAELEGYLGRARGSPGHTALRAGLYDGHVRAVDRWIGELMGLLRSNGRYADALVAVTGTRGALLAPPPGSGAPSFLPAVVRVPLIVRFPGGAPVGRSPALVQAVDLWPTLAEVFSWPDALPSPPAGGVADARSLLGPVERGERGRAAARVQTASMELHAAVGRRFQLEENRVGGLVAWRRDGTRVAREQDLPAADVERLGRLRAALEEARRPAQIEVQSGGGAALRVRWRFTEGFAAEAQVLAGEESLPARMSGLGGQASLPAAGGRLVIGASRRELPARLDLALEGALEGGAEGQRDGAAPELDETRVWIGERPLAQSALPRLPAPGAPPWPVDAAGAPRPAAAVLEQQSGTWWRLTVGGAEGQEGRPAEVVVALFPPGSLDERLEWAAVFGVEAEPFPGRADAWRLRGTTPLEVQLEKAPSREFGLAVLVEGRALTGAEIRHRGRRFGEPGELALYLPDWLAGVTDDLGAAPAATPAAGGLRVLRHGPDLAPEDRRPLPEEARVVVQRLGGGE